MAEPARKPMTVDDFLAWSQSWAEGERFELWRGAPVAMSPERNRHALAKSDADTELKRAVAAAGLPCTVFPDGVTVVIGDDTAFEPDAVVDCGPVDLDAMTAAAPVIVVEVLSPGTRGVDTGRKLADYFSLGTLRHYLVIDAETKVIVRHSREAGDGPIATTLITEGRMALDPPGLDVDVAAVFARV